MLRNPRALYRSSTNNPWGLTVAQRYTLDLLIKWGSPLKAARGDGQNVRTLDAHIQLMKWNIYKRQGRRLTTLQLAVEYALWKAKGQPAPEPPATMKEVR